ncbi:MAG: hypothetical protein HRU03_08625 [Nanoarchaeales archaeon]|nr:hypothetical protein [Nanoarchaeales archaeon]
MGKIINILNKSDDVVHLTIEFDRDYFKNLRGSLNNIHLFCDGIMIYNSKVVSVGKNNSTKYFLIPKEINSEIFAREDIKYSVIEMTNKFYFLFSVDKF